MLGKMPQRGEEEHRKKFRRRISGKTEDMKWKHKQK
jgi:hypothetical protein